MKVLIDRDNHKIALKEIDGLCPLADAFVIDASLPPRGFGQGFKEIRIEEVDSFD
jgi:hypothetical protein